MLPVCGIHVPTKASATSHEATRSDPHLVAGFHPCFVPPSSFPTTSTVYTSAHPVVCFSHTHPWGWFSFSLLLSSDLGVRTRRGRSRGWVSIRRAPSRAPPVLPPRHPPLPQRAAGPDLAPYPRLDSVRPAPHPKTWRRPDRRGPVSSSAAWPANRPGALSFSADPFALVCCVDLPLAFYGHWRSLPSGSIRR